jgi:hypothetical protein
LVGYYLDLAAPLQGREKEDGRFNGLGSNQQAMVLGNAIGEKHSTELKTRYLENGCLGARQDRNSCRSTHLQTYLLRTQSSRDSQTFLTIVDYATILAV